MGIQCLKVLFKEMLGFFFSPPGMSILLYVMSCTIFAISW